MHSYRLIRSSRKTISLQITPVGELVVRCPTRMKKADVDAFVISKGQWIRRHLPDPSVRALMPFTAAQLQEMGREASADLPDRVARLAAAAGVTYGTITVRNQRTRWGSCSSKGNLSFKCLLMQTPPGGRDYVVVHELCHRKEMNHSPAFWSAVERIMPDYREHRKWLKENGSTLIARLP